MDIFDRAGDEEEGVSYRICSLPLASGELTFTVFNGIESPSTAATAWAFRTSSSKKCRTAWKVPRRPVEVSSSACGATASTDAVSRFIESEADLDSSLKLLLPLTQNPPLFYPELVKAGTIALLAGLLSHENTDIAIDVVEVLQELTDEDVGAEVDDLEDEGDESTASLTRAAMGDLIGELVRSYTS